MNWMERMIRMRKEVPEIGWGDFSFVPTRMQEVLAMRYFWKNNSVLCVHNFVGEPREVRLSVPYGDENANELVNLLSDDHSHADSSGRHLILLEPYGYRWYRVGGLDYLLKRSPD
jgi:maltose alpha-D-glucosyltransferase/alpha-amylase